MKLKQKIEELQALRRSVPPFAPPFGTPDQVPAWIPVSPPVVDGFSAGSFPGAGMGANRLAPRKLRPSEEALRYVTPEKSAYPFTAFVPMPMAPVAPVVPEGASAIHRQSALSSRAGLATVFRAPRRVGFGSGLIYVADSKPQRDLTWPGGLAS